MNEWNKMDDWREYYERVFGFSTFVRFDEGDISTQYSALKSIVVRSKNWKIKLPINEPAEGLKKSQIEEYLEFNEGAGVQHIAILTDDIISSISSLKKNGVEFLDIPSTYYNDLSSRVGGIDEEIEQLKQTITHLEAQTKTLEADIPRLERQLPSKTDITALKTAISKEKGRLPGSFLARLWAYISSDQTTQKRIEELEEDLKTLETLGSLRTDLDTINTIQTKKEPLRSH